MANTISYAKQYVNNQAVVQGNNGMLDQQGINMMLNNF